MVLDLQDARVLLEQAKTHIAKFNSLANRQEPAPIWSIVSGRVASGEYVYALRLNRQALRGLKPVLADAVSNLVHCLDHVAAACCRAQGNPRARFYFPVFEDDQEFSNWAVQVRKHVGDAYMDLFADLRARHRAPHPDRYAFLALIKKMANENKHWSLALPHSDACSVSYNVPRDPVQKIFGIPAGYFDREDEFAFYKADQKLPPETYYQFALRFTVQGFATFPDANIDAMLAVGTQLVEEVIVQTEGLAARLP